MLFILFKDFQILDAAGPIAAFEIAAHFVPGAYRLRFATFGADLAPSSSGAAVYAEELKGLRADRLDTLIVVGGQGTYAAMQDAPLCAAIARLARRARRTGSVCSGAFILAAAGLLDGKQATTHWRRAPALQRQFPKVKVNADRIWTRDGAVWTSAGISAGVDLALAMISEDLGPEIAREVAREMVVYAQRPGGQSQHSALVDLGGDNAFAQLNAWMRSHLRENLSVARLAAKACMSERNFARAYVAACGLTPAKAVEKLRLEAARAMIESGEQSLQKIAAAAGFSDPERMRRAFTRFYGATPSALKQTLRRT